MENTVVRRQDKRTIFLLLINEDYEKEVEHQRARSSFKVNPNASSQRFEQKLKLRIEMWQPNKTLPSQHLNVGSALFQRCGSTLK